MTDPIDFYFEFGSPYGYFAAFEIEKLAEEFGRDINWRPFMLGTAFAQTGSRPFMDIPLKGPYSAHDWERMASYTGTPFQMPEKFPAAILAPGRGFYWLKDMGRSLTAVKFAKAAYKAYFAHGRAMWLDEVTADVAAECGIDRTEFLNAIQQPVVKDRLKQEGQQAIERGVFGSPFIIADGEAFWGWDRLDMVRHWLKHGKWEVK